MRKVSFVPEEFYHIYNRGNSRQAIFLTEADYFRFMALLYLANSTASFEFREIDQDLLFDFERGEQLVSIGAYCLMPNHFHILVTPLVDSGVVTFMRKLATSYSMYFNKKHHRTGSLFEGRFKSEHVDNDKYLKYLFSYIHLNPVKLIQSDWKVRGIADIEQAIAYLEEYTYSSYAEAIGRKREESSILNIEPFPVYFESVAAAQKEIKDWLSFSA